jgi:hypothetical protein
MHGLEGFGAFVLEEVEAGAGMVGLYPATKEANLEKYEDWRKKASR